MKVLVATEKPFAKAAINGIKEVVEKAGFSLALLEKYADKSELNAAVADADALIIRSDKVTAEVVEAAKNLKIVVRAGAGYDNVDLEACTKKGVVVMNTPGQNSNAVAELAMGMMIFMSRNQFTAGTGKEICGKRLGIHAYGNIGRIVAKYAKAFGMDVYAYDPYTSQEIFKEDDVKVVDSVDDLYSSCDFVSVHIPATEQTKKMLNYSLLSQMPKGATLINTARKEVVNEEELVKLLSDREDIKYITDIAADNQAELSEKFGKRVLATMPKKIGAETAEANINAGIAAARQIVDYLVNGNTRFQVNK